MKRIVTIIILLLILICVTGCNNTSVNKSELTIFAASSMTEALSEIATQYSYSNPSVEITFNFDSSGTLKTQIEEGAACDVFISASQKPMNELDCVDENSRIDLLENKVAFVVSNNNPKGIASIDDVITHLNNYDILMAVGNSDVPVGEYTLKIFDYYDINLNELNQNGCITYCSNAKEVTTQVSENLADCGFVYQTDAVSANLTVIDTATKNMCGEVIYPAAVINTSQNIDSAKAFLNYLKNEEASQIFLKYGFIPVS